MTHCLAVFATKIAGYNAWLCLLQRLYSTLPGCVCHKDCTLHGAGHHHHLSFRALSSCYQSSCIVSEDTPIQPDDVILIADLTSVHGFERMVIMVVPEVSTTPAVPESDQGRGCSGLWIEIVPLLSGSCTVPSRVDGQPCFSSISQDSHMLAPSATPW